MRTMLSLFLSLVATCAVAGERGSPADINAIAQEWLASTGGLVMANNLEILGQFMYPAEAYRQLLGLVRSGLLDLSRLRPKVYPLTALPEAMDAAAEAGNLESVVIQL
jgi:threonine dehydrogenase-like Zn-dependent dehydrogenase